MKIPFQERFREPLLDGTKLLTCRTKAYGKTGDTFEAFDQEFELLTLRRVPLAWLEHLWQFEGVQSFEEFKEIWIELHPRARWLHPEDHIWLHGFVKADASPALRLRTWWDLTRRVDAFYPAPPHTMPAGIMVSTGYLNDLVDKQKVGMDGLPDGIVRALYRAWSEERWAAGWIISDANTVKGFRDWVQAQADFVPVEDYEIEGIQRFHDLGASP